MARLKTFPISLKVAGKRIVIIGGGIEALNKTRLAIKTAAHVEIYAEAISDDLAALAGDRLTLHAPIADAFDFSNVAMVFVAEETDFAARVKAEAQASNIPLNVVDVPDSCDFYTPAIVDRAPLTVAISSEGEAPVLARLVRAKIEALLSPKLGAIAKLAGDMRSMVSAAIADGTNRRRYYERLVNSPEIEGALDIGVSDAWRVATGLLEEETGEQSGTVWLIGAGPGAEDLLTLRAQRLLQEADVIVYDQLVPELVVQMGRRDAERVKVGKKKGHHSFTQAQINTLLVRLARKGKRIARLKSGDPMIFGRAGEEIAALKKAGITYSIVPGVTAALATAADSATPVTLRRVSSGFVIATAHGADDREITHWASLAQQGITLGIYMGKTISAEVANKLITAGLKPSTPVGVAVKAGRADKVSYRGSLADLTGDTADFADGPALILVGDAVAHGDWAGAKALATQAAKVA